MKLDKEGLQESEAWKSAGYHVPAYDREVLTDNTKQNPQWIHFGAGNIFRSTLLATITAFSPTLP